MLCSVVPRSRFLGDTGVPLPEFQGDIYKFWGTHQIFHIVDWRRGVDDSEEVSAIALVLNSPANLLFLY